MDRSLSLQYNIATPISPEEDEIVQRRYIMIKIEIPGRDDLSIEHVVLDYNGTIAVDGHVIEPLKEHFRSLLKQVDIIVLTADTYGTVRAECEPLGLRVETFPRSEAARCKAEIVKGLSGGIACFGNGFNDIAMFDLCDLAVAVIEGEGMCAGLLSHADVLVTSACDGLDLLLKPDHLRATLRT